MKTLIDQIKTQDAGGIVESITATLNKKTLEAIRESKKDVAKSVYMAEDQDNHGAK